MRPATNAPLFSLRWVFVSYFAILGGIVLAVAGLVWAMQRQAMDPRAAAYLACAAGGLIGGFFSGRASHHFSILEPAAGGALTVAAVYAMIRWTAIGPLAFAFAEAAITREGLIVGGLTLGGGLTGALLGEMTWRGEPSTSPVRWLGMTALFTLGALLFAIIVLSVVVADQTLRDPEQLAAIWNQRTVPVPVNDEDVARVLLIIAAVAGFFAALSAQLAAPARMIIVSTVGVFGTVGGLLAGALAWADALDSDTLRAVLLLAGAAAVTAIVGAALAWLLRMITE